MAEVIALTRAEVEALEPCSLGKLTVFSDHEGPINARQALEAGASISDLLWVAEKLGLKMQIAKFALACALRVAHITTAPEAKAARDAAQKWLDEPTDENARFAGAAAYRVVGAPTRDATTARAAYEASEAAYWAARTAENDTSQAAWEAAWEASAAAITASWSTDAPWEAEREAQRAIFLEIFCPEPDQ